MGNRAVFNTAPASGTPVHIHTSCPFSDPDLEISRLAFNGFKIRIRDELDIQMPADLDQFG